jgi:hypothetical protein
MLGLGIPEGFKWLSGNGSKIKLLLENYSEDDRLFEKSNVLIKNEIAPEAKKEIQKRLNEQLESKLLKPLNKKLLSTNKTEIGDYIVQVNIFQK